VRLAFYISGHGFGHASRAIELIRSLVERRHDLRVLVKSVAPAWFFESVGTPLDLHTVETDTGVVQIDNLRIDEEATVRAAAAFYSTFDSRADLEAAWLKSVHADVVVGDIPPLAFAAAARAAIPSIAVGNFTWDWIYRAYPVFERLAPGVTTTIGAAYACATYGLRLPLHGGFGSIASVIDIPFIARQSTRDPQAVRDALGIDRDKQFVLASFSGYGVSLPADKLSRSDAFVFRSFDRPPNGLRYEDIVRAADVVVSKPGYGIVSDCVANDTSLLYTSRGRFAEYDVFVREMPRLLRCRYVSQSDLLAGNLDSDVLGLLAQPVPSERPSIGGAASAARIILDS